MKPLTKNLKYFSGIAIIFSIVFFYNLYAALQAQSYNKIWVYALLYGILMFCAGLILGYRDPVRESRTDLGFQYHLITFIIVNAIGIPALFFAMGLNIETITGAILQSFSWGLGLFVHYYFSSKSLKGMDKEEVFV